MTPDRTPDPMELHAYVDGELSPERAAEIERLLAERPELRAEVDGWIAQKALLKQALAGALRDDADATVKPPAARVPKPGLGARLRLVAATAAVLAIGVASGFYGRGLVDRPDGAERLMAEALAAHTVFSEDPRRPVELGDDERALLDRWLSKRVGHPLSAPDFATAGFEFLGGRLIEIEGRAAALFVYRDAAERRLSLIVTAPDDAGSAPDAVAAARRVDGPDGLSGYLWRRNALQYVLAANHPTQPLEALARRHTP